MIWPRIAPGVWSKSSYILVLCLTALAKTLPISSCSSSDPNPSHVTNLDVLDTLNLVQIRTCSWVSMSGFSWLHFNGQNSMFLYILLKLVIIDLSHLDLSEVIVCFSLSCIIPLLKYEALGRH